MGIVGNASLKAWLAEQIRDLPLRPKYAAQLDKKEEQKVSEEKASIAEAMRKVSERSYGRRRPSTVPNYCVGKEEDEARMRRDIDLSGIKQAPVEFTLEVMQAKMHFRVVKADDGRINVYVYKRNEDGNLGHNRIFSFDPDGATRTQGD